jgi:hypothetical protein
MLESVTVLLIAYMLSVIVHKAELQLSLKKVAHAVTRTMRYYLSELNLSPECGPFGPADVLLVKLINLECLS